MPEQGDPALLSSLQQARDCLPAVGRELGQPWSRCHTAAPAWGVECRSEFPTDGGHREPQNDTGGRGPQLS